MAIQQGMNQQTPAVQALLRSLQRTATGSRGSTRRKKRSKRKSTGSTKRARKSGSRKLKRLVKGSAAAKAHMAKLRAKRKK